VLIFPKEDIIRLAEALDSLGVKHFEPRMPVALTKGCDADRKIIKAVKTRVATLSHAIKSDVDVALGQLPGARWSPHPMTG
jgi:isopropylmalate/homocitrate/citramalate synthase